MAAAADQQQASPHINFSIHEMENGYEARSDLIKEKFQWLSDTMSGFSGHDQRFFLVTENKDKVVQIGGWDRPEDQFITFHATSAIDDFLEEFGGILDVKSTWHTTIPYKGLCWDAPVVTFVRMYLPRAEKASFEGTLPKLLASLQAWCGASVSTGWRMNVAFYDNEAQDDLATYAPNMVGKWDVEPEECDEFDVLIPWNSLEATKSELSVDGFSETAKYLVKMQVKHMQRLSLVVEE